MSEGNQNLTSPHGDRTARPHMGTEPQGRTWGQNRKAA